MTSDQPTRSRATLDFSDFANDRPAEKPKPPKKVSKKVAEEAGFTSRQSSKAEPKVDGRTLRATGRKEQLNIAVKPETKQEFWKVAQRAGFTRGEEFLLAMMEKWEGSK